MRPRLVLTMAALAAELFWAGCAVGRAAPPRPAVVAIEQVAVEPKTLDFGKQTEATLRYALTDSAAVTIEWFDEDGRAIRRMPLGRQKAGKHAVSWNARDGEGILVPNEVYRYVIRAQSRRGQEAVYDPSQEAGGEEVEPRNFEWDPQTSRFRWVMPKAGRARLRIGIEGFPHLRTLLDWNPLEAGEQGLSWDGMDASGLIHLKGHPNLAIKLASFALAPNTVIVQGSDSSPRTISSGSVTPGSAAPSGTAGYFHARHPRNLCREARLQIYFPQVRLDAVGRPLLRGKVLVRVILDPADKVRMTNERFELALFEDLSILFEEEEAIIPYTFEWDTSRLEPGQHLLTVNVLGREDHFGVSTQAVLIEAPS